jgi:hypothetical protein
LNVPADALQFSLFVAPPLAVAVKGTSLGSDVWFAGDIGAIVT